VTHGVPIRKAHHVVGMPAAGRIAHWRGELAEYAHAKR
jgi:hypothetical protein